MLNNPIVSALDMYGGIISNKEGKLIQQIATELGERPLKTLLWILEAVARDQVSIEIRDSKVYWLKKTQATQSDTPQPESRLQHVQAIQNAELQTHIQDQAKIIAKMLEREKELIEKLRISENNLAIWRGKAERPDYQRGGFSILDRLSNQEKQELAKLMRETPNQKGGDDDAAA